MTNSLKSRLILLLSIVIAAIALIQVVIAYEAALREADDVFDYHLEQMASSLQQGVSAAEPGEAVPLPGQSFDFIVQIWSQDGTRLYQSRTLATLPDRAVLGFSDAPNGHDGEWRVYAIQTPTQTIQVAQDMAARNRMARNLALHTVWPLVVFAPLLMVMAGWVVSRTLRPVARVRAIAAARGDDDLSPLPVTGLPDEVLPLVCEINSLFARVQGSLDGQRRFIADAAHELRTPLAALKLQVQGLRRAPDRTQRERGLQRLEEGIERAARLVGQLLTLARQEALPVERQKRCPVDLSELARSEVAQAAELAAEKDIDLGVQAPQPVVMSVMVDGLRAVFANLIDNALKYTPPGGRVDVCVMSKADGALIEVADSGPGIAPEMWSRVFDRFVRVAEGEASGAGLGLAIVRTIVEQHGGQIELHQASLGGLLVSIRLPLA